MKKIDETQPKVWDYLLAMQGYLMIPDGGGVEQAKWYAQEVQKMIVAHSKIVEAEFAQ